MQKADIPLIRELALSTWTNTYIPIIGIEQVNYMLQLFYSPEALSRQMEELCHEFIVIDYENKPIGFASWSLIEPSIYKLHKLYVLPENQRSGAGNNMLQYIVDQLKNTQAQSLILNVNRHNEQAIKFYYKLGFMLLKKEDIDIGSGFFMNDYVLQYPL